MSNESLLAGIRDELPAVLDTVMQDGMLDAFVAEARAELACNRAVPAERIVMLEQGVSCGGGPIDCELEGVTFDGKTLSYLPPEAFLAVSRTNLDGVAVTDDGESAILVGVGAPRVYTVYLGSLYVHPAPFVGGELRYRKRGTKVEDETRLSQSGYKDALRAYVKARAYELAAFMCQQRYESTLAAVAG